MTDYYVAIGKSEQSGDRAYLTVSGKTKDSAKERAKTGLSAHFESPVSIKTIHGPFPNISNYHADIRPKECNGCGRKCWTTESLPTAEQTWFEIDSRTNEKFVWQCIICHTKTHIKSKNIFCPECEKRHTNWDKLDTSRDNPQIDDPWKQKCKSCNTVVTRQPSIG